MSLKINKPRRTIQFVVIQKIRTGKKIAAIPSTSHLKYPQVSGKCIAKSRSEPRPVTAEENNRTWATELPYGRFPGADTARENLRRGRRPAGYPPVGARARALGPPSGRLAHRRDERLPRKQPPRRTRPGDGGSPPPPSRGGWKGESGESRKMVKKAEKKAGGQKKGPLEQCRSRGP